MKIKSLLALVSVAAVLLPANVFATNWTVLVGPSGTDTFSPRDLTIAVGDTVTWQNISGSHNVVANDNSFNSGPARSGAWSFTFTFTTARTIGYFCQPHQQIGMTGTINVQSANTPPTVSLTSPTASGTFNLNQTITVAANASDNVSVSKVEFFDGTTLIGTDTSAPYSISYQLTTKGSHSFTAKATDNQNASTTSSAVAITVANIPPVVSITSPASGASLPAGTPVQFQASATDSDGSVVKVEYFNGRLSLGSATTAPFTVSANLNPGAYNITAVAADDSGSVSTSQAVSFTVAQANAAPTISISSPENNVLVIPGLDLILTANAADQDGSVARVEYFSGTTSLGSATISPFQVTTKFASAGVYTLTAVATDNLGAQTTSSAIKVRVASRPTLSIRKITNDQVRITSNTTPGLDYTLQGASELTGFTDIATSTPAADGSLAFDVTVDQALRFFRVVIH